MIGKKGLPGQAELVVCEIKDVNPYSASAYLLEYNKNGMVHISEITKGWVKDIRRHVSKGQRVIGKVIGVDKKNKHITLSLKRVSEKQKNEKKKEYKLEQKGERMLRDVAKKLGKNLEQAYKKVGYSLQDNFGSVYNGFKTTLTEPGMLKKRGIPQKWIGPMSAIAKKRITRKEYEFKANLILETFESDGVERIKRVLEERKKLNINYISAPKYGVRYKTKAPKKGEKYFRKKLNRIVEDAENKDISARVEWL